MKSKACGVALLAAAFATCSCRSSIAAPPAEPSAGDAMIKPSTAPTTAPLVGAATAPTTRGARRGPASKPADDHLSVTDHSIQLADGATLAYTTTAGTMVMKDEAGKPKASFFFTAYEEAKAQADGERDPATRPITYVFNGGPGAASAWLHLGTVGPRTISLDPGGLPSAPPHKLIDNPNTWLTETDLVFIDPVGTGFSRPAPGEDGKQFYGVQQDIESVADFIRLYTTRYERWASPKFLAGESYGTTRAAALSDYLGERYGLSLNGIVLVSTILNFQTVRPGEGNDLPYSLYLPTYAAVAAYHKKSAPELGGDHLPATLKEVEAFAMGDYSAAIAKGSALPIEERKAIVDKLARYTGLSSTYIDRANLRIPPDEFEKRLLEDNRKIIGRFDGRISGVDPQPTEAYPAYDPSLSLYLPVYSSTFNDYVRRALGFETDLPYELLTGRVQPWDFGRAGNGYLNVAADLRDAIVKHPHLKVLVCSGRYDLATPYLATNYTVDHMNLGELRGNVTQTYYDGGHMLYHVASAAAQLKADVAKMIGEATRR